MAEDQRTFTEVEIDWQGWAEGFVEAAHDVHNAFTAILTEYASSEPVQEFIALFKDTIAELDE